MKYPLIPISISFILGILGFALLKVSFLILFSLSLLFLLVTGIFIKDNTKFTVFILCTVFLLGGLILENSRSLPDAHISRFTSVKADVILTGTVNTDPVYKKKAVTFILKTQEIKIGKVRQKVVGRTIVKVFGTNRFSYGDTVLLKGKLFKPFSFSKDFDYREYLSRRGIYSILNVRRGNTIKYLGHEKGAPLKSFALKLKHRAGETFDNYLSKPSAAILNAVILGQREHLPKAIKENLIKTGSVHIIAISGLHVGIVALILLLLLKILRIPYRIQYIITILALVFYCILTGARLPVVRATTMAAILLFGYFLERDVNIYNSLAIAALLILGLNPAQIFDASFQLSFLSVLSIVWLTPRISSFFPERFYKINWTRFFILLFSVSMSAWLGLAPLIMHYFKIISPITVLANMIVVPYMTLVVASGFVLAVAGNIAPFLAQIFAGSSEVFVYILLKIGSILANVPGAYKRVGDIPIVYILLYYTFTIWLFSLKKPIRK